MRKRLVDWILSKPEGKQFLSACIITILGLVSCIAAMEARHERNIGINASIIKNCEAEKFRIKERDDSLFLVYVIYHNTVSESNNRIVDSLIQEIILNHKKAKQNK